MQVQRFELGTFEREKLKEIIKEQKRFKISNIGVGSGIALGGLFVAGAVGLAGYFMMPNLIDDVKEKLDLIKSGTKKTVDRSSGLNDDGSYATILCVGYKDSRQWTDQASGVNTSPNEGKVVVNKGSGIPVWGGITGAGLFLISYGQDNEEWVGIYGNFNKDATFIDQLSDGWSYMGFEQNYG